MSDLSDLSDLSDICAAQINRVGKKHAVNTRGAYLRGAPQYRQGMTAFPPPPARQGGVMMLPATGRRPFVISGLTGCTKLALQYRSGITALVPPGLAYLTGYAPMQYDRCGMTAAWGRRFDV